MAKLGLKKIGDESILIYQHNDSGPILGQDIVIAKPTVGECLDEFATWYKKTYEQNTTTPEGE